MGNLNLVGAGRRGRFGEDGDVRLVTIGAFARAARLTPKALRLYDQVGLLPPAAVDPESGYRLYDPEQLPLARLVAQLRRIGMPLARIRAVCALEPVAAAQEVTAYWQQVTADTAARARLATVLVDHLSHRGPTRSALTVRHAAGCDPGVVRDSNEDVAYASDRLLAVADGMRGPGVLPPAPPPSTCSRRWRSPMVRSPICWRCWRVRSPTPTGRCGRWRPTITSRAPR
ncbi:hypothetical protein GCM10027614_10420 [Micromonospora vulcania]